MPAATKPTIEHPRARKVRLQAEREATEARVAELLAQAAEHEQSAHAAGAAGRLEDMDTALDAKATADTERANALLRIRVLDAALGTTDTEIAKWDHRDAVLLARSRAEALPALGAAIEATLPTLCDHLTRYVAALTSIRSAGVLDPEAARLVELSAYVVRALTDAGLPNLHLQGQGIQYDRVGSSTPTDINTRVSDSLHTIDTIQIEGA